MRNHKNATRTPAHTRPPPPPETRGRVRDTSRASNGKATSSTQTLTLTPSRPQQRPFVLVLLESIVSKHKFVQKRARVDDKLELWKFDPYGKRWVLRITLPCAAYCGKGT
ncbi:hypothetical protein HPB50_020862 [Hyalomma asiaticum]|uniref:Uncharacterized protein n=1 Tax=Hyalomma asiaticum TaxID=266040 RepID=A0ACB7RRZ9_HYAAI|nr:hypothetical protein HPB50_020862 [Hyalomma asiaticum]